MRHFNCYAILAAILTLPLAGCDTAQKLNPFAEKEVHLQGERRPVFPPGSDFAGPRKNAPPGSDYGSATIRADQPPSPAQQPQQPAQ